MSDRGAEKWAVSKTVVVSVTTLVSNPTLSAEIYPLITTNFSEYS